MYEGDTLLGELENGVATKAYIWGVSGLGGVREFTQTPRTLFFEQGVTKEIRNVSNATGTLLGSYSYNAYGVKTPTSTTISNPVQYAGSVGCYTEDETKLILCGARWYSPSLMRWMSRDPIGYEGGVNLYGYVKNDPINYYDRTGLEPEDNTWFSEQEDTNKERKRRFTDGPRYGNWCGKDWSGGPEGEDPPIDSLDDQCKKHDDCWGNCDKHCIEVLRIPGPDGHAVYPHQICMELCNKDFVRDLEDLPKDPRTWPRPPKPGFDGADSYKDLSIKWFK
jgi:RHS repeat-associated protein